MLESGSSGSVRGVLSNEHPYREPGSNSDLGADLSLVRSSQQRTSSDCIGMSVWCQKQKSLCRVASRGATIAVNKR